MPKSWPTLEGLARGKKSIDPRAKNLSWLAEIKIYSSRPQGSVYQTASINGEPQLLNSYVDLFVLVSMFTGD